MDFSWRNQFKNLKKIFLILLNWQKYTNNSRASRARWCKAFAWLRREIKGFWSSRLASRASSALVARHRILTVRWRYLWGTLPLDQNSKVNLTSRQNICKWILVFHMENHAFRKKHEKSPSYGNFENSEPLPPLHLNFLNPYVFWSLTFYVYLVI